MTLSVFDIFKIGIGPSSSHTMGPMRAAHEFVLGLERDGLLQETQEIAVRLYGSLALTGVGHGTDRAILLGLEGADAETVDPDQMEPAVARIRASGRIRLLGRHEVPFDEPMQLLFMRHERLERHSNGMRFTALGLDRHTLREEDYFSIGGGFILRGDETPATPAGQKAAPYPFDSGDELLVRCRELGLELFEVVMANERTWRSEQEVRAGLLRLWNVMQACVERGFRQTGLLPGVLKVRRRAPKLYRMLTESKGVPNPLDVMDWVNAWALAVNEENAAGGRVVTAPTNGAAGIVPAVLHFYRRFEPGANDDGVIRFLLTAGAIGMLYKKNASISGGDGLSGRGGGCLLDGGGGTCGGAARHLRTGGECRGDRHGTQSWAHLRSGRRARADPLHRAKCHGRRQSHQCGASCDPRRRHAQGLFGPGDRDHAPDRRGHVDYL